MLLSMIFGLCLMCLGSHCIEEEVPTTSISLGNLEGYYKLSFYGRKFAAFEGIPYAKPPIGDLRFEPPQEPEPWTGVLKANKIYTCTQTIWSGKAFVFGNEDCLYLNVYALKNANNFDVMVFIHGGAFMQGNSEQGGPGYVMDKDIVYVSINYRLGPFGFLSTEDEVVPGNMGLKDQVLALVWVKTHVEKFGGNPNSITITGASAGGASVHLHYFSPLSRGLFYRGISHSGTALMPWAIHKAPLRTARKLAATIGCDKQSTRDLVACMKNQTAADVVKNVYTISKLIKFPIVVFGPVIEKATCGAFLSDSPYTLLKDGKVLDVPWLTSGVTEEGILGLTNLHYKYDVLNENWDDVSDVILNYEHVIAHVDRRNVAQTIRKFYLNNKEITEDNVKGFINLFGDRYVFLGMEKAARLQARLVKSPVYVYMYGYQPSNLDAYIQTHKAPKFYGITHGADGMFTYTLKLGNTSINLVQSENDIKTKDLMTNIVTKFAKNGNLSEVDINWGPVSDSKYFNYFLINNDGVNSISKAELAPTKFWESLPFREPPNIDLYKNRL